MILVGADAMTAQRAKTGTGQRGAPGTKLALAMANRLSGHDPGVILDLRRRT